MLQDIMRKNTGKDLSYAYDIYAERIKIVQRININEKLQGHNNKKPDIKMNIARGQDGPEVKIYVEWEVRKANEKIGQKIWKRTSDHQKVVRQKE